MTPVDFITTLRRLELTQNDIATIAGVTPRQVNSWVRGVHTVPRSVSLILLALDSDQLDADWLVDAVEREVRAEAIQAAN
jgi:transcriptional regulator with XRE-family HTH domain